MDGWTWELYFEMGLMLLSQPCSFLASLLSLTCILWSACVWNEVAIMLFEAEAPVGLLGPEPKY